MRRQTPDPKPEISSADVETRVRDDHHASVRLWLRLLACTNRVENLVRQSLQTRFETTLPRFDLMAQLDRVPAGLKMSELSQRLMVTGGNVTGITDGLQRDGLVLREIDLTDRRVFRVKLTPEGQRQFQRMAAEHERWIVELFAPLSMEHKRQLTALLAQLKQALPQASR